MDLSTFVGKLLEEQNGDVLREGIRVSSQVLMESDSGRARRGAHWRTTRSGPGETMPRGRRGLYGAEPLRERQAYTWERTAGSQDSASPETPHSRGVVRRLQLSRKRRAVCAEALAPPRFTQLFDSFVDHEQALASAGVRRGRSASGRR